MSDELDQTPPAPTAFPTGRDPELAAALAVPALDAATRRALVRTAVEHADGEAETATDEVPAAAATDELAPRRGGRLAGALGLAAALVIGAVVGAVIVTQPDDQGTPSAAAPSTATDERAKAAAPDAAGNQESAAEAPA